MNIFCDIVLSLDHFCGGTQPVYSFVHQTLVIKEQLPVVVRLAGKVKIKYTNLNTEQGFTNAYFKFLIEKMIFILL